VGKTSSSAGFGLDRCASKTYLNGKVLLPSHIAKTVPEVELMALPGIKNWRNPASGRCRELKIVALKASWRKSVPSKKKRLLAPADGNKGGQKNKW